MALRLVMIRRRVVNVLLAAVALGTITTAALTVASGSSLSAFSGSGRHFNARQASTPDLLRTLINSGVTPTTLAAVGASEAQVSSIVSDARQYLFDHGEELQGAANNALAANAEVDRLSRRLQEGHVPVTEGSNFETERAALLAAYEAARSDAASAQAVLDAAVGAFRAAALVSLSESQRSVMTNIRSNFRWRLPTKYLAVNRSESEWIALRDAIASQGVAVRTGQAAGSDSQARIAEADGLPATAAVSRNLDACLVGVKLAFDKATRSQ